MLYYVLLLLSALCMATSQAGIFEAITRGDLTTVKAYVEQDINTLQQVNGYGETPLQFTDRIGQTEITAMLSPYIYTPNSNSATSNTIDTAHTSTQSNNASATTSSAPIHAHFQRTRHLANTRESTRVSHGLHTGKQTHRTPAPRTYLSHSAVIRDRDPSPHMQSICKHIARLYIQQSRQ